MTTVQLHPHFVAARSYADVSSVVQLLKEPIDDANFKTKDDAPYLPAPYTSTIHMGEAVGGLSYPAQPLSLEQQSATLTATAKEVHAPFAKDAHLPSKLSLFPSYEAKAVPKDEDFTLFSSSLSSNSQMRNSWRSKSSTLLSLSDANSSQRKVLCIWDLDDTLVTSGVSGARQNSVFRDSELVALFRSAGKTARHLFLSQGSIDDVLEKPCGRLSCLRPFLERTRGRTGSRRASGGSAGGPSLAPVAPSKDVKKERPSIAKLLCCGAGSQIKAQPSFAPSVAGEREASNGKKAASSGSNDNDLRYFAPGTVVVRLSTLWDRCEAVEDAAFLTDPTASPTCCSPFHGELDEKAERPGRWLILRPEVWGITLASMGAFFPPSRTTAFVNGKIYRKMDVVWSLAMSGEWDSVLFIDNNLSELGVVRCGQQISDLRDLSRQRNAHRFFQSNYLFLATSAKLRELELRYGRDVTRPPNAAALSPSVKDKQQTSSCDQQMQKVVAVTGTSTNVSATARKSSIAEETDDLSPSKSATVSSFGGTDSSGARNDILESIDAGHNLFAKRRSSLWGAGTNRAASDVLFVNASGGDNAPPHPDAAPILVPQRRQRSNSSNFSVGSDCFSLTLSSFSAYRPYPSGDGDIETATVTPLNSTMRSSKQSCKHVDLVVVNLHMPSEAYRQVLTTAYTRSDRQHSMECTTIDPDRYVGQPLFAGNRSCTDEQYMAIFKCFQEAESALFQLIDEDMRANGFVNVSKASRWVPDTRVVHAPVRMRPTSVPHMLHFYKSFFEELEEWLDSALQHTGDMKVSRILLREVQRQYYVLQRALPFIDPYLTGDLSGVLFDICITGGRIPRSLLKQLKKMITKTRARIQSEHKKRR
ncbi:hypothetical protein JIQ42_02379 [Leishmania sp. Namibia]|uniref:hypothetical protein n=1 Tax=Leishmania sp. Namibia TaxID=2802991 RepID=UPI001B5D5EA7|nr:hypothetical protein JIQ42_02379 [Leishmania sp. Namibia]